MTTNNETAISDSLSVAPDVPWAAAAFDLVLSEENRPVANHSVRSWALRPPATRSSGPPGMARSHNTPNSS